MIQNELISLLGDGISALTDDLRGGLAGVHFGCRKPWVQVRVASFQGLYT